MTAERRPSNCLQGGTAGATGQPQGKEAAGAAAATTAAAAATAAQTEASR